MRQALLPPQAFPALTPPLQKKKNWKAYTPCQKYRELGKYQCSPTSVSQHTEVAILLEGFSTVLRQTFPMQDNSNTT